MSVRLYHSKTTGLVSLRVHGPARSDGFSLPKRPEPQTVYLNRKTVERLAREFNALLKAMP